MRLSPWKSLFFIVSVSDVRRRCSKSLNSGVRTAWNRFMRMLEGSDRSEFLNADRFAQALQPVPSCSFSLNLSTSSATATPVAVGVEGGLLLRRRTREAGDKMIERRAKKSGRGVGASTEF